MKKIPNDFPITVFEDSSEKISDTLTKKRVRIFYKGANRNGSYITDEFAEKLISTLAYAPVKGIYDEQAGDYTDHGIARSLGRIYGVVPENCNFAWEKHLDADGIEREYACADVYLFTAIYEEANEIDGKSQSMELYGPSIKGEWVGVNGQEYFRYTDASFLGLQVLGDQATPCFEGSAFFTQQSGQEIYALFTALIEKLEKLSIGGNSNMPKENLPIDENFSEEVVEKEETEVEETPVEEVEETAAEEVEETEEATEAEEVIEEKEEVKEFVLSDNQKQSAIGNALNAGKFQYIVMDSYSDYAIVYNLEDDNVYKVNYSVDNDEITIGENMEQLFAEWVTRSEKDALNSFRQRTEIGTFEAAIAEVEKNIEDLTTELNNKNDELSTLNIDKEQLSEKLTSLEGQIEEFTAEVESLKSYKEDVETQHKNAVIAKYSTKLSDEILNDYRNRINEFTITDLEKELAYTLVMNDSTIFSTKDENEGLIPLEAPLTGVEALISKHKK